MVAIRLWCLMNNFLHWTKVLPASKLLGNIELGVRC